MTSRQGSKTPRTRRRESGRTRPSDTIPHDRKHRAPHVTHLGVDPIRSDPISWATWLRSRTERELRALAEERKITGIKTATRAKLIAKLLAPRRAKKVSDA